MVCGFCGKGSVFPGSMEAAVESVGAGLCPRPVGGRWRFCRGRPMCRPGHGFSRNLLTGGHIGPPLRGVGRCSGTNGDRCENGPCQRGGTEPAPTGGAGVDRRRGVVTPPYGCNAGGAQRRADVPKAWLPPTKFRAEIWGVSHRHRPLRPAGDEGRGTARRVVVPYGWLRRVAAIARASGAQRSVCGADGRNGLESEQRSPPKVFINLGQSLSHGCAMPAPFAQGSLSLRGTGG